MQSNSFTTQTKRSVVLYTAAILLLQILTFTFQGAMAQSVTGYTDTRCTMYGPVTVFVEFENNDERESLNCFECSTCIIQADLNAEPVDHNLRFDARYLLALKNSTEPLYSLVKPQLFSHFLSRAPPA